MADRLSKARKARAKEILDAIGDHHGNVSALCAELGIARSTFYWYRDDFPEIAEKLEEVREDVGEKVEHALIQQALDGNITAQIFFLKTQRGWSETRKLEVDQTTRSAADKEKAEKFDEMMAQWEREHDETDADD